MSLCFEPVERTRNDHSRGGVPEWFAHRPEGWGRVGSRGQVPEVMSIRKAETFCVWMRTMESFSFLQRYVLLPMLLKTGECDPMHG